MLDERYREHLAHAEMVGAFTTAAVMNFSMGAPEKPVEALRFMPNAKLAMGGERDEPQTEEELQAESDYNLKVLQKAAEMKAAQRG